MRPWHRGTNNIKDLQDRRDLQGVEIKAVVVGGLRGGCAGDRSTATNPPAGAFHHHSWTPGLRFVGPEGTQRGFNESPTQPVACSALPEAKLMFFLLWCCDLPFRGTFLSLCTCTVPEVPCP